MVTGTHPARNTLAAGLIVAAVAMGWFSLLTPDQNPLAVLLPAQLVGGIGLGIGIVAATVGGVQGVAAEDTGVASGLVNTSQQIGGALGLAILASVATATAARPGATPTRDALTNGDTTGLLGASAFYLTAMIAAPLLMRPRPSRPANPDSPANRSPEPVTSTTRHPSEQ
ncbi:hypothetical protein AB0F52_44180 [Amycolatopsis sp. NPDC024027]|uniref:hypothetical protein n=1 Tax=Amycolatopsis sp. NPDC024027 TaxID=3154327 RepID=UPI0033F692BE